MGTRHTLATHKLRDTSDLGGMRATLREALESRTDHASLCDVVVATQEAVTNSLRASARWSRRVKVRVRLDDDFVWVDVVDRGRGIETSIASDERPSTESTHGRGLYLMGMLMDVVEISSRRGGSRVSMGKRLSS